MTGNGARQRRFVTTTGRNTMTDTTTTRKEIADWIGDIVALESHVEEALDHQLTIDPPHGELKTTIQYLHDTCRDSKQRAVAYQEAYGSTAGNPVIKVGSELLGKAAGLIDKVRKDTAAKALRDDAPAFGMLNTAYAMLHTTALAFGDEATAEFAKAGMHTYARLTRDVSNAIPLAVYEDLKAGDSAGDLKVGVVETAREALRESWETTQS
jgi:hypothetical protein